MPTIDVTHPEVAAQWHPTLNGDLKPSDVTAGCNKKMWWKCPKKCPEGCEHVWEASLNNRCKGRGCPYCAQKKVSCKHISIVFTHPDIAAQWHPTKNNNLQPDNYTSGCGLKVWWLCSNSCSYGCPHEWEASIDNRCGKGKACPYCSNPPNKICTHSSIMFTHADIAKEWHPTKNNSIVSLYSAGSNKKVWWLCSKSCSQGCLHEWEASINDRCGVNKNGCPYCSHKGNKLPCIHDSLQTTHPEISKEWHPTKNKLLKPSDFTSGSGIKIWWLCSKTCIYGCAHEWETTIASRCSNEFKSNGCPHCSRRGNAIPCIHNSLQTTHLELSNQWHPTKNGLLKPTDITFGSNKKVWWKCVINPIHEWEAVVASRSGGCGCPHCVNKTEAKLLNFLKDRFPDVEAQFRPAWCKSPITGRKLPFDFYIPSLKLLIELDGAQHFRQVANWGSCENTRKKDVYKMQAAVKKGLSVVRLLQEEVFEASEEELLSNVLPHLVALEAPGYVFIVSEETEHIYDEHERLLGDGSDGYTESVESDDG